MLPSPFAALVTHEAGRAIVYVTGEMDLATAPPFQREVVSLLSLPVDTVAIDLECLTFIDSSGLSALNAIRKASAAHDVRLVLQSVPAQAFRTLEICGMAECFELVRLAGEHCDVGADARAD